MSGNARILIVDDSTAIRNSVKQLLAPLGAELSVAVNGSDGLSAALEGDFDIIISDVDMPKMNGIELCRRLKEAPSTRGTPLILLSSFDSDADIEKGFQIIMDAIGTQLCPECVTVFFNWMESTQASPASKKRKANC